MSILATRLPEIIGLTILHSLWQITLLWIVLIAVLRLWPKASSTVRYILAISTLMLSVLATAATTVFEWQSHATGEEVSALSNGTAHSIHTTYITVKETVLSNILDALNASVPIVAWLWCAGLVVMATRFAGSFFYLRTLRAQKNITALPAWEHELKRLAIALRLKCDVAIATSSRISSPLTLGSFSPVILLPAGLLSGLSTAQIEAILVHELYHIKRRDYIINIFQALIEVLLFYHPAIWHINKIIREERENCCDDKTLAFCGDAITYARALTQIQEVNTLPKPTLAMSALGSNEGNFSHRIKRLFNIYPNPSQARSKGIFAIGFLMVYLGIVLAGANVSTAQPGKPETKQVKTHVNNDDTSRNVFSDSIPVRDDLHVADRKEITPLQVVGEKIIVMDLHAADTTVKETSLDKCLDKVRLMLKMLPLYKLRGVAADTLPVMVLDSMDFATMTRERHTSFYGNVNVSRINKVALIATVVDSMTIDHSPPVIELYMDDSKNEIIDLVLTPSRLTEELREPIAVQVFPNSTDGRLNISFTPSRNNSRVKIVLVDSGGNVVKEITDSTYDNIPIELHVDVSSYKKGIYILQINIDGAKSQERVVVE
jgi:beta-lactamase regulating signal transducer with metallopeptidase domain